MARNEHQRRVHRLSQAASRDVERDLAGRLWAELALIELGSVGLVRHLHEIMTLHAVMDRFETTMPDARTVRHVPSSPNDKTQGPGRSRHG